MSSRIPPWWKPARSTTARMREATRIDGLTLMLGGSDGPDGEGLPVWRVLRPTSLDDPAAMGDEIGLLPVTLSLRDAIDRADRDWPPPSWIRCGGES